MTPAFLGAGENRIFSQPNADRKDSKTALVPSDSVVKRYRKQSLNDPCVPARKQRRTVALTGKQQVSAQHRGLAYSAERSPANNKSFALSAVYCFIRVELEISGFSLPFAAISPE